MSIDVVNFGWVHACFFQGFGHRPGGAFPSCHWLGQVMRVRGGRIPFDLAQNRSATIFRAFFALQHQHGRALTHDETVTVFVERAAGFGGIFVEPGKGSQSIEPSNRYGDHWSLAAAG